MSAAGSITYWLRLLPERRREAVQGLWQHYFQRLVRLARQKLQGLPRQAADEEDVALSAFASFCQAAEQGRFPRLDDRDDLWQVLVVITSRKAWDLREYEGRDRRDWRRVQQAMESAADTGTGETLLSGLLSREPDPAFAAEVAEECRRLLDRLGDEVLRGIALRKMEGHTNEEIAAQLDCSPSTIERRLRLIRKRWEREAAD